MASAMAIPTDTSERRKGHKGRGRGFASMNPEKQRKIASRRKGGEQTKARQGYEHYARIGKIGGKRNRKSD